MRKEWLALGLSIVLAAVIITYSNHFHNALHFDDAHTIENNAYIQDIKNIPLFFKDGSTSSSLPSNQSYRPLLTTTLAIDYKLGGGLADTFYFHLTSFTFFILQGILMFFLFRIILRRVSSDPVVDWVALFAVAWFLLHPVCAETINYIIQRGDSLSTFFVVLALTVYAVSPLARRFYLYLIPLVLGILTKPSALMFAPILFCYVVLFEKELGFISFFTHFFDNNNKPNTPPIKAKTNTASGSTYQSYTGIIVSFAVCILGYLFVSHMISSTYVNGASSPGMYRLTQPFIIFTYFTAWFAPIHLNADTDWFAFTSVVDPYAILGYVFLLFLVYTIFITSEYKSTRPIAFGLGWFLLACAPTSLAAFSEITNDHRMFFPFVGLSLAIVWTFYLLARLIVDHVTVPQSARYVFYTLLLVLLTGYAYGTHERNKVWNTDEALWKDCTEKSPKNGRGLMNYGLALMARGDYAGAEKYFSDGLMYWPNYSYLDVNMAILKDATGKKDEAEKYFKLGLQNGPLYPNSYYYYGRFLNASGRKDEAVSLLKKAMQMTSAHMDCRYLLMDILYSEKRLEELKEVANSTIQIAPNDPKAVDYLKMASGKSQLDVTKETAQTRQTPENYLNLSLQYYNAGDYEGCINAAKKSLELRPDYAAAYNNIGSAYNVMKKYKEGKEAILKAIAIDPVSQLYKNNLAVSEAGLKGENK
jgi:tetratricopeptide (TPR) repeat protein